MTNIQREYISVSESHGFKPERCSRSVLDLANNLYDQGFHTVIGLITIQK